MAPVNTNRFTQKLPASTLVEAVIALVILLTSLTATITMVSNMYGDGVTKPGVEAHIRLCEYKDETLQNKLYTDERKEVNGLILERKISPYQPSIPVNSKSQLLQLRFTAYTPLGDTLSTQLRLIVLE